jgi:hypothetical protein
MNLSAFQLCALALVVAGYSWLAFRLGMNHERDSKRRALYRRIMADMKAEPEIRKMAETARRRAEMRRLTVLKGGLVERGPFALPGRRQA